MYSIDFTGDELSALAGHLISHLSQLRLVMGMAYAESEISKNQDYILSLGVSDFENILEKLLNHLPSEFRDQCEKALDRYKNMEPLEALEEIGAKKKKHDLGENNG